MTEFVICLLGAALATTILAIGIKLGTRLRGKQDPRFFAWLWLALALGPPAFVVLSTISTATHGPRLGSIVEPTILKLFSMERFGVGVFHLENGIWFPELGTRPVFQTLFWIWVAGASAVLIARGYQLFLAQQFTIWAEDTQDERLRAEAQEVGDAYNYARSLRIRDSHLVRSPLVVGFIKFTLLMPVGMSRQLEDQELRAILAHEFSHIVRKDTRTLALLIVNECLFWFSPTTWWIHREWATNRELDADQEAISQSQIEPKRFANLLLSIVTSSRQPWLQTAIGATRDFKALKSRISNMNNSLNHKWSPLRTGLSLAAVAGLLIVPWRISNASPPVDDGNMVVNGGFENGLDTWTPASMPDGATTNVSYGIDTDEKHSGKASMKFEKRTQSYFPVQMLMAKLNPYKMTTKLETTVWIKAKNAGKATMAAFFHDSSGGVSDIKWIAYASGSSPTAGISHDWKKYHSVIEVPSNATSVDIAVQMYGPGQAWFDDIEVKFASNDTKLIDPVADTPKQEEEASDVQDVPNVEFQAKKDPNKDYFLIGSKGKAPEKGYKLLVVLPGGPGNKDFNPFIRRVWKNSDLASRGFVIAELVAPVWEQNENRIVWPTRSSNVPPAKFKTEEFVNDVIADVQSKIKIDPEHVYLFGWSSGGPACYASLLDAPAVKGAFIGMSVFYPQQLPSLKLSKGRSLYLYQSPDDTVTKFFFAEKAKDAFTEAGARVKMVTYPGGHGFTSGKPFEDIQLGLDWLVKRD